MKKVFVVILFLVLIMVMAAPVGAKKGEDVTITVSSEYTYWPEYDLTGTWESSGAVESSGDLLAVPKHFGSGSPHGKPFQTAHVIEVIGNGNGSLTISAQLKDFEFFGCDAGMCYNGGGTWVILSGTGEYANARGQGTVSTDGVAFLVYDEEIDDFRIEGQDITSVYSGLVHFAPK